MAKRPIQEGDYVILTKRRVVKAIDGMITITVNNQRVTMPADSDEIEMRIAGETFERPKKLFDKPD